VAVTYPGERRFVIRRQQDGSFTVSGDQGLPAFTMFLTGGWQQVHALRQQHQAVDHFPVAADFQAFCAVFGEPPKDPPGTNM
jgi:hypothetical protein